MPGRALRFGVPGGVSDAGGGRNRRGSLSLPPQLGPSAVGSDHGSKGTFWHGCTRRRVWRAATLLGSWLPGGAGLLDPPMVGGRGSPALGCALKSRELGPTWGGLHILNSAQWT
ncbi:hypothetical protein NDU88_006933 [Pleurodeles waltl]|uniref:Uncharacterized protein n=1 Tax=Pleurodeles waltl TaxID=8319 RepID=A0AAV7QND0_PLEWA|nr:hypothetical protein NDU88_006933 [Pleurodeles waltl]